MTYFILESPTRGIVHTDNDLGETIKFTRADQRSDERAFRFFHAQQAIDYRARLIELDPPRNRRVALELKVRRSTDWHFLCLACGKWIAEYPGWHTTTDHEKHCPARGATVAQERDRRERHRSSEAERRARGLAPRSHKKVY